MQAKKKICAGCLQTTYIYKNIGGNKYCKTCAFKLQPPKAIPKRTEKQVFKMTLKKSLLEEDKQFYQKIWEERTGGDPGMDILLSYPKCECCNKNLGSEPNLMYFHHILEKRNYPELRHEPENIAILCPDCHNRYETNPDKVPYLKQKRKQLLDEWEEWLIEKRHNSYDE
jgi:hypothetical protein